MVIKKLLKIFSRWLALGFLISLFTLWLLVLWMQVDIAGGWRTAFEGKYICGIIDLSDLFPGVKPRPCVFSEWLLSGWHEVFNTNVGSLFLWIWAAIITLGIGTELLVRKIKQ